MKTRNTDISIYPVERAERLARIMGEHSAAADALKELKRRLEDGEDVVLMVARSMIFVGPRPR
jgi:hypothetical protein